MTSPPTDLETLALDRPASGVARISLRRPDRLNAMSDVMFAELEVVARSLRHDPEARAVLLTGEGRAFCAGFDLDDAERLPHLTPRGMYHQQERGIAAVLAIHDLAQPVIALVDGAAAGGGFSLALTADIRIGTARARFNAAFVRIGLTAGDMGASWHLPRIVGPGRAADLMFTGRMVEADEAERIGLLNRVVADAGELEAAGLETARAIAANSPFGVELTKRALRASQEIPALRTAIEMENRGQALATQADDMAEALAAFRERRAPRFADGDDEPVPPPGSPGDGGGDGGGATSDGVRA